MTIKLTPSIPEKIDPEIFREIFSKFSQLQTFKVSNINLGPKFQFNSFFEVFPNIKTLDLEGQIDFGNRSVQKVTFFQ